MKKCGLLCEPHRIMNNKKKNENDLKLLKFMCRFVLENM